MSSKVTDSLINLLSGLGTDRDKRTHTQFTNTILNQETLQVLYKNWMFGKSIDIPAIDMTRKGRLIKAPSLNSNELEAIKNVEEAHSLQTSLRQALKWSGLFGGAAILVAVNDGKANSEPLVVEDITKDSLQALIVLDRYALYVDSINTTDITSDFRLPSMYTLSNMERIHASRIIRFDGFELPWLSYQDNEYWGGSICERIYDEVLNAKIVTQSIASMIFETSVDVIGIKGLFQRVMDTKSLAALQKRFLVAAAAKSNNRVFVIDKDEEEYHKEHANFTGLAPLMSEQLSLVASAADIPVTRYLGVGAKGLNASGESDLKIYYDRIASDQADRLMPQQYRLDQILVRSALGYMPDDWQFQYNPLWQSTEKETSEINKINADTDNLNISLNLIKPSHAAARLLEKGVYPTLDATYIEKMEAKEALEVVKKPTEEPNVVQSGEE